MKVFVTTLRILAGALFIFSGLVKAIDPLGLAYKMQEFFEVWGQSPALSKMMNILDHYAVGFAVIMITLEVAVGVALLLGWQKKISAWILLALIVFFTFLTAFVLFTGKIRACGCFGDCIPLTPVQTFTKDILLLVIAIFVVLNLKHIRPVAKPWINGSYVLLAVILTVLLQSYVMKHLPIVDCLPFKKGNNILELRKMPANAIQDKFDYVFIYEKAGVKQEFKMTALPDSTWNYVDRKQILVEKGSNNIPLINDFFLTTQEGGNATESVLNEHGEYFLFFVKELPSNAEKWLHDLKLLSEKAAVSRRKLYIVTGQRSQLEKFVTDNNIKAEGILTADVIAIKTAARANPTLFLMDGPVVKNKWSWADLDEVP